MNILLYKGQSSYEILRFFIDEMASAFTKLGHNTFVVDLLRADRLDKLFQTLRDCESCDFVFAFNGIGIGIDIKGQELYDFINVPFVAALVDHPCQQLGRLDTKLEHLIVTCTDKSHLKYLSSIYPPGHLKLCSVLSTAGTVARPFNLEDFDVYLKTRTIPVLFAGSFIQPERTWLKMPSLNNNAKELLNDMADYILSQDCIAIEEACKYVAMYPGTQLSGEAQKSIYESVVPLIDKYIRGYCRYRCFETLAEAGVPVVSCSQDWDNYISSKKYKSVSFIGVREYGELLRDLQKTKIFLNTTTNLVYGASERVFNAMLNGAVAATQANYSDEFIDGQDSILYQWTQLDKLPGKIFNLLDNPATAWQIAKTAETKAAARHTWLHRAQKVLDMVREYKAAHNLGCESNKLQYFKK